jgi:carbamoyltransferase
MKVLGIHYASEHDAAAALVVDGALVAAVEEERLCRVKHAARIRYPRSCIACCLDRARVRMEELDAIALSWDIRHGTAEEMASSLAALRSRLLREDAPSFAGEIIPINHHVCHAASAFFSSPYDEAAVLVVDGGGERLATSIWHGRQGRLELLREWDLNQSLGYFYEGVSRFLGYGYFSEGKTMALSAYGRRRVDLAAIQVDSDGYRVVLEGLPPWQPQGGEPWSAAHYGAMGAMHDAWVRTLEETFGLPRRPQTSQYLHRFGRTVEDEIAIPTTYADVAAACQAKLEEAMLQLARLAVRLTGCRSLAVAGGVGLNCLANGRILREGVADALYVFPAAADSGTAVGAAFALAASGGDAIQPVTHGMWGPSYGDDEIRACLEEYGIPYAYHDDIAPMVAECLEDLEVVCWFQGPMEFGPRALGCRSILANPSVQEMQDYVNIMVKNRAPWRPFAPSILADALDGEMPGAHHGLFMNIAYLASPRFRQMMPAAVHIDGTTRTQAVSRVQQPTYWRLINAFHSDTGIPGVLNTSFNLEDEPIVCTPRQALRTFYASGADTLALGNFLVRKHDRGMSLFTQWRAASPS